MRVVLPLLKPATFAVGEVIVTPKIGTREMGFIMTGEVEVSKRRKMLQSLLREYLSFWGDDSNRTVVEV